MFNLIPVMKGLTKRCSIKLVQFRVNASKVEPLALLIVIVKSIHGIAILIVILVEWILVI